jgi:hypothetical protein
MCGVGVLKRSLSLAKNVTMKKFSKLISKALAHLSSCKKIRLANYRVYHGVRDLKTIILDLYRQNGFIDRYVASTNGGEYKGPCPECGGLDRFTIWPEMPNKNGIYRGGRYICRQCGKCGDAIQYLRDFHGMTFPEACSVLGIETGYSEKSFVTSPYRSKFEPRETRLPGRL